MKHSASGVSMISSCEEGGEGGGGLYVDLCNLIVESRTPSRDSRGYGDGTHCPPIIGPTSHVCDPENAECQKHQTILHHLLEAVASNVFQIEVLLLPECCLESKLKERIQNKEYILVERWSMNFIHGKTECNIEVSQLLRAVRSFLHFSQLSAWLSSTSGKSPANICYWVNPKLEASCTKFKDEPEVHLFPICKVNEDLYGRVKVEFPVRTQYIPMIPCSKHPPICRYSLREINKDSDLCQNISFDPQIVRQLHKTCDTEQNKLTAINYVPEPTSVMLTPTSLLKTFSSAIPDGGRTNRVLKHSNLQGNLLNSATLSLDVKGKTIDIIPKKPSTFVCNYAETISLGVSQENFCGNKRKLEKHLRKTELKLKKMKKEVSTTLASESLASLLSSDIYKLNQNTLKHSMRISDVPQVSNLPDEKDNENSLLNSIESSLVNLEKHALTSSRNLSRQLTKSTKVLRQKDRDLNKEEKCVLPNKEMCCDLNLSSQILKSCSAVKCTTSLPQCTKTSQLKEEVHHTRFRKDEFQNNSSSTHITPSNHGNDIKILEVNHQNCSNYLFPFQCTSENIPALHNKEFANSNASTKIFTRSSLKKAKSASRNSELKLSKRKCTFQLDCQTNNRKKSKSLECNKLLNSHLDSICNTSRPHFSEAKQKHVLVSKDSDKKTFSERHFFRRRKLEKNGSSEHPCSSCLDSKGMYQNSKQIEADIASSNDISKSNSCEKDNSMMRCNMYHRKQSLNCYKSSFHLQSLQNRDKRFEMQETDLKSNRLLLDTNQTLSGKNVRAISNVISENPSNAKSLSSWAHDCMTSNMIKTKIESAPLMIPKERVLKRIKSKNNSLNNNPVLKKRNVEEKTVHTSSFKLHKLFKFKKASCQNICKRKMNIPLSQTYLRIQKKSNSSQTLIKKSMTLSMKECQNNIYSNVPNELMSNTSYASANSTTELQRTTLTGIRNSKDVCVKNDSSLNMISLQNDHQSSFVLNTPVPTASRNVCPITDENNECFPNRRKFPKGRKLLMNFEESILKGCLPMVSNVKGFRAEIGASGSFCPNHLTLPADVSFYELGHPNQGTTPYVAHVSLSNSDYYLPKKGAVQVTLFNPSETVVKMFVLNYDLTSLPPLCHTFIRQKTYSLPVGVNKEHPASQKWLRFIIHLRFASSKTGRISLHEDFKIVVLNKTNDDAASEFSQEPRELCSFLSVPMNPSFSSI